MRHYKMSEKTHYRKVFKSDHLGVADLEDFIEAGSNMTFTVSHVLQHQNEQVAGKKINCNVAYFVEKIKPLVLNSGNSKVMKGFAKNSPFVEDWNNIPITLYIDHSARLKGEVVGGVRINPSAPKGKQTLTPDSPNWQSAVDAYKRDGNLDAVLKRAHIAPEHVTLITGAE
jgi:hypothetical protein